MAHATRQYAEQLTAAVKRHFADEVARGDLRVEIHEAEVVPGVPHCHVVVTYGDGGGLVFGLGMLDGGSGALAPYASEMIARLIAGTSPRRPAQAPPSSELPQPVSLPDGDDGGSSEQAPAKRRAQRGARSAPAVADEERDVEDRHR